MNPDFVKQLDAELCVLLHRYGQHVHAVHFWTSEAHGAIQIGILASDRRQNLTGLNNTGLEQVVKP